MKEQSQPSIQTAKAIADKFGKAIVIVLTIEEGGRLTMHSWGKDRPSCQAGGNLGDMCFQLIMDKFKATAEQTRDSKGLLFKPRIVQPEGN